MPEIWSILYEPPVLNEHIPKLPKSIAIRIAKAIDGKLVHEPIRMGKPLRHQFRDHRRIRVGDYRILYRVEAELNRVLITAILHRSAVYEG